MKEILPEITEQYTNAIQKYLETSAGVWPPNSELGHQLLAVGLGISDVAAIHQKALETVLENCPSSQACIETLRRSSQFLRQILLPFEQKNDEERAIASSPPRDDTKRVVRAIYLAAKLGFTVEKDIITWSREHHDKIREEVSEGFSRRKLADAIRADPETTIKLMNLMIRLKRNN